jgi:hypothetical protein
MTEICGDTVNCRFVVSSIEVLPAYSVEPSVGRGYYGVR